MALPKYLYPHEAFDEISKLYSFQDRVKLLKEYQTFSIKTILQANFSNRIIFDLPPGEPPFMKDDMPVTNSMGRIDKAIKVLPKLLIENNPTSFAVKAKKETQFMYLLEAVNQKDAAIIIAMKDKKLSELYPVIDRALAHAAFPEIVSLL